MWEGAKTIYNYVDANSIYVEDLDIQLHVYVFPMTKDLLAFCKENSYRFNVLENSGSDEDTIMSYPHYDFTYTDIDSVEWVTNCTEETKFSVGTCASAGFDFSIFSEKYLDDGSVVTYDKIAFKGAVVIPVYDFMYNDALISKKQLGVFHVTDYENESGMINFTCLDNMRFFDKKAKDIDKYITVPVRSDDFFAQILLKLNLLNGTMPGVKYFQINKVDHLKKLTYRTIISYAMEVIGAFAYANNIGEICGKCFNASDAPVVTIPYDDIMEDKSSGAGVKINGYEIQYGSNMAAAFSYAAGEEEIEVPVPMTVDNPLFIKKKQESLDIIGERVKSRMYGFTFEPYEVSTFLPNFKIEAGDFVNVEDKYGELHKILVSQLTWRDNLEMEIVSVCDTGGTDESGSSDYDSDVNEAIQRNGNIDSIPFDGDGESDEPTTVEMTYTGKEFNSKIKTLSIGKYTSYDSSDYSYIRKIIMSETAPEEGITTVQLHNQLSDSDYVIFAWYKDYTVFIYSDADTIVLPEDFSHAFRDMGVLGYLDLTKFDFSKVKNMSYMFYLCGSGPKDESGNKLEEILLDLPDKLNTSNVTNMNYMLSNNKIKTFDLSKIDTSNVTDMSGMFSGNYLTSMDLSGFDTSKVTNMSYMFETSFNITSLDVSNFDTSNVTDMSGMFRNLLQITSLDLSNFDTSKVTDMKYMFRGSSDLENIYVSEKWDTSNVTSMDSMFESCGTDHVTVLE